MALAIDGLISGLGTTELINQLMTLEATPQTLLKGKVTTTQSFLTALQSLNSSFASLATLATKTALPTATDVFTATSSASSVSVTATAGAAGGQLDLSVTQIARAQVSVSAAMTAWPDDPPTLTIVGQDGTARQITAASTSLSDIATAINAAGAGVQAVRVAAGTDPNTSEPLYRLQLSSTATGAQAAFEVFRGTSAEVTAGTATNLLTAPGAATVTAASDASVTLWAGTAAEQVVTSATNSFTDILPGVSVTVSKVEASPVTLTVARDSAGTSKVASTLVSGIANLLSFIDTRSAVTTSTSSAGATTTTSGVFTGNGSVREARAQLSTAVIAPVNGRSPSEIGISFDRYGAIQYDEAKFTAALTADPAGTQAMLQQIATRVGAVANGVSDRYEGTVTQLITGQESAIRTINDQIGAWDVRLAAKRAGLERVYSALEVQLSNLKSQSSWLTSQLAALSTSSS